MRKRNGTFVEDMTQEELRAAMSDEFEPVRCDPAAEIAEEMRDPEFKRVWDAGAPERITRKLLLAMRKNAALTQEEIAAELHTTKSAVSRMESAKHSPTFRQLFRYADVCGFKLEFRPVRTARKTIRKKVTADV